MTVKCMERKFSLVLLGSVAVTIALSACSSAKSVTDPEPSTSAPPPARSAPPETASEGPAPGPAPDIVTKIIQEALRTDGSVSYEELVQRLGAPQQVRTDPTRNAYQPDQVDTLHTLTYRGIEALVYDVSRSPKTFLIRLSLTNDRYATPEGLRVGDSRNRVLELVGPPTKRSSSDGALIYAEDDSMPTAMIVTLQDGRVVRVDWEFYFS